LIFSIFRAPSVILTILPAADFYQTTLSGRNWQSFDLPVCTACPTCLILFLKKKKAALFPAAARTLPAFFPAFIY
jgi:hypothetical protein